MGVHSEAGVAFDPSDRLLEGSVGESLGAAASVADDVVMVLAVRIDEFEPRLALPDLEPADRTDPFQVGEDAVDARGADWPPEPTDLLM